MALRCLIVDNNAGFLDAATALLEHGGITVVGVATTGVEALRQAAESWPDVILLDIDLTGESGFDVADRLEEQARAAPDRAARTIVMISTHAEEDFEDLIMASPAVGFLAKSRLSANTVRHLLSTEQRSRRLR